MTFGGLGLWDWFRRVSKDNAVLQGTKQHEASGPVLLSLHVLAGWNTKHFAHSTYFQPCGNSTDSTQSIQLIFCGRCECVRWIPTLQMPRPCQRPENQEPHRSWWAWRIWAREQPTTQAKFRFLPSPPRKIWNARNRSPHHDPTYVSGRVWWLGRHLLRAFQVTSSSWACLSWQHVLSSLISLILFRRCMSQAPAGVGTGISSSCWTNWSRTTSVPKRSLMPFRTVPVQYGWDAPQQVRWSPRYCNFVGSISQGSKPQGTKARYSLPIFQPYNPPF